MGVKVLRKFQVGRETTAGTAVPATAIMRLQGAVMKDDSVRVFPAEDVAIMGGTDRRYTSFYGASVSIPENELTFEQFPHILEMGMKAVGTPAADTGGSGKIYTYSFPILAANTPKTYTCEFGDDAGAERMAYGYCRSFKITGKAREGLKFSAELAGRQVSPNAFTSLSTLIDVEEVLFNKGKLYIDNADGTIGSTLVSGSLMGMDLSVETGFQEIATAEGELHFAALKQVAPEVVLNITFEHDANSIAQKALAVSGLAKQIRMVFQGTALTTAGSTYTYKTFMIDLAGKWEMFNPLEEQDGNDMVTGVFRARYNSDAGMMGEITVVNQVASL